MVGIYREPDAFDFKLATECADAYADSTGLGCTVSDPVGRILHETGYGCGSCNLCGIAGLDTAGCGRAHAYGMTEAERFGGKYIYFCPMGLTCFVTPIMSQTGSEAKITVGPFLMVDRDDYVEYDLRDTLGLNGEAIQRVTEALDRIPFVSAGKVNALSNLLFMAVGFLNNVSASARMLETRDSDAIQGQITEYILALKGEEEPAEYPMATEKALLSAIADSDKAKAQKLLNELLGYILFSSGGDFSRIKSRIYELLVLISRAAADAGASHELMFQQNHNFFQQAQNTRDIDELCFLLAGVMNRYIDSLFEYADVKHADVIHKAVRYMRRNSARKLTLEEVSKSVYLSPSYFSKVFKKETNTTFNTYLNRIRVDKSKDLLMRNNLRLADIAAMAGFEDQSYFTKVFKRITGVSPNRYRESGGRASGGSQREETKISNHRRNDHGIVTGNFGAAAEGQSEDRQGVGTAGN